MNKIPDKDAIRILNHLTKAHNILRKYYVFKFKRLRGTLWQIILSKHGRIN